MTNKNIYLFANLKMIAIYVNIMWSYWELLILTRKRLNFRRDRDRMSHTYMCKKLANAYRKWNAEKPERYYVIDGFNMDLGEGHRLQLTQKYNPMYDRFVPYLGRIADAKKFQMR